MNKAYVSLYEGETKTSASNEFWKGLGLWGFWVRLLVFAFVDVV